MVVRGKELEGKKDQKFLSTEFGGGYVSAASSFGWPELGHTVRFCPLRSATGQPADENHA